MFTIVYSLTKSIRKRYLVISTPKSRGGLAVFISGLASNTGIVVSIGIDICHPCQYFRVWQLTPLGLLEMITIPTSKL